MYKIVFPKVDLADEEGLLCYGGNLHASTLLEAYKNGIFPWYNEDSPILWWSPPLRMVLAPFDFKPSKSLLGEIKKERFIVKFDTRFEDVIKACAFTKRKNESGTWITDAMIAAYTELHHLGYAHSVECYLDHELVGGLYGVSLGKAFFGESMFHTQSNASKVAFYYLVERLKTWQFLMIDAQQETAHLKSLGAKSISRDNFIHLLKESLKFKTKKGSWAIK